MRGLQLCSALPFSIFGKGDGRSYHYFQLSDVRIFSFWKEHCQHLGHYGRCCFVCEISWYFFKTLSVCRSVRHQSFPYYDTDDAYRKISCAGLSYAVTALGLAIGFVLPPLCTHVHYAHQGYSLYNVGFGAGIIATVVVSLAKSFGIKVESRLIWSVGNNTLFAVLLMSLFGCMIASAVAVRGKTILESYRRILKTSGIGGTDYLKDEGGATTVFNMGVNGLFATLFVLAVKGDLNGPTICGILRSLVSAPQESI